jgi:hypothetical protein
MSGSRPGERRGGRKKGTPNRATVLRDKGIIALDLPESTAIVDALKHPGDGDAVDFLTRIYRDPEMPISVRIDCAKVVAPFHRPRLTQVTGRDGRDLVPSVPAVDYREWALQQIRDAFGPLPLTIEHQIDASSTSVTGPVSGFRDSD